MKTIGRIQEQERIRACLSVGRSVLLEGPVGSGKTHLALAMTQQLDQPIFRVDGDSRYTEQKLSGWFDPPAVIQSGYRVESFIPGPLVEAMRAGGVLFINELNRLPEGVQNILLPAIDERLVFIPRLGEVRASNGFLVIATQNPKEFVATSHLSEAILDRFELVRIDYQSEEEEVEIVLSHVQKTVDPRLPLVAVRLCRRTRSHPHIRRGASIRAALGIAEIGAVFLAAGKKFEEAFLSAVLMAVPTRIEIEHTLDEGSASHGAEVENLLTSLVREIFREIQEGNVKKKP